MSKRKLNLYLFINALVTGILIVVLCSILRNLNFWITLSVVGAIIVLYLIVNVVLFYNFLKRRKNHE